MKHARVLGVKAAPGLLLAIALLAFSSLVLLFGVGISPSVARASDKSVTPNHPRLLLTPTIRTQLLAKKNANDPTWQSLKTRADTLATYSILPYIYITRTTEIQNTIFYDYQGSGWYDAALPLALAYQMTGDTQYSNKLIALADEMIAAQTRLENTPPTGLPPLQPDNYYPTRYLGPVIAIIYDWCYDQLGAPRRAQMVSLMNTYFDDLRTNAYQRNDTADGNYFIGHMSAAGYMGYASYGDNARAQEMIDYARIRFDGTPSALVATGNIPESHFDQVFDGGYKSYLARGWNGPNITGAPFKGGFDFQGWSYGSGTFDRVIDYMQIVKTATGEDLFAVHPAWLSQILRAQKHALMPDHFQIDVAGDWGGMYGGVIFRSLSLRLAYALAGTADGPAAQHFAYSEILNASPYPDFPDYIYQLVFQPAEWENFIFGDTARPSAELILPPYYTGFVPIYPQGVATATNGAIPYFILRSDWGPNATWASLHMGAAFYDDHQHHDAGSFTIKHANDFLLIDASNWKGAAGSIGIVGDSTEADTAAAANTLWFNDLGDFQSDYYLNSGGQNDYGMDQVIAAEQNAGYTYARGDLSSAYNRGSDPADQTGRKLDYFYRSFLYLRPANLFVVYDQVKAIASANLLGSYRKHIRWHFPTQPTITGKTVRVDQGASRLYLDVLLPSSATLTAVDESTNLDPCDNGTIPNCTPYDAWFNNSNTWRVEVRDPSNPLAIPFLTVLQPGAAALPPMTTSNISSLDAKMIGAVITQSGTVNVVFFNNQAGSVPTPITTTSYNFTGPSSAIQTLGGFAPNARYRVARSGSVVSIAQNDAGDITASPAGVLQFTLNPPLHDYLPLILR